MCLQLPDTFDGPSLLNPGIYTDPGLWPGHERITVIPLPDIQLGPVIPTEKREFRIITTYGVVWPITATHYVGPGQLGATDGTEMTYAAKWFVFYDGTALIHQIIAEDVRNIFVVSGDPEEDVAIAKALGLYEEDDEDDLDLEADSQAARQGDPVIVVKEPSNTKLDRKKNA